MSERFYVSQEALRAWEAVADPHIEDMGTTGTLARALSTLIDAYRHAAEEDER